MHARTPSHAFVYLPLTPVPPRQARHRLVVLRAVWGLGHVAVYDRQLRELLPARLKRDLRGRQN